MKADLICSISAQNKAARGTDFPSNVGAASKWTQTQVTPDKRIADVFGYFCAILSRYNGAIEHKGQIRAKSVKGRWQRANKSPEKRQRERARERVSEGWGPGSGGEGGATWERRWMVKTQWSVNATWESVRVCVFVWAECVCVCVCLQRGGGVSLRSEMIVFDWYELFKTNHILQRRF